MPETVGATAELAYEAACKAIIRQGHKDAVSRLLAQTFVDADTHSTSSTATQHAHKMACRRDVTSASKGRKVACVDSRFNGLGMTH